MASLILKISPAKPKRRKPLILFMSSSTLRETEIRPDHLMKEQADRFAADVARLLMSRSQFIEVPCPACGANNGRKAFEKFQLTYLECSGCETVYVSPRPTPAILEDFYAHSRNYAYWNEFIFPASEEARRERIFRPRADRVAEICQRHGLSHGGVLMEVGAGFGTFCEEIQKHHWFDRVIAVEPTPGLAETCRKKGLEVIEKPVEQITLSPGSVNVIACFEVIEHLFSPRDYLRSCASLLAPEGLLVVTCPNIKGFDLVTLREISGTVDVEHLNYFHPDSLSRLARESGLEVLEVTTPGKLDAELVRKKVLGGEFDMQKQPFLKQILIDRWEDAGAAFQEFLAANRLSSHMWLVARKRM
jgi:2-polyprenyl-3-methyl-5-hydroxy-6-metoxy-1,4-benzoquinol methylase/ribosomal protein S27E